MRPLIIGLLSLTVAGPRDVGAQSVMDSVPSSGTTVSAKNPETAARLAIIPGVGHVYAGSVTKGVILMLGTVGGAAIAFESSRGKKDYNCCETYSCTTANGHASGVLLGVAISMASWGHSLLDARKAAVRYNAKHGVRVSVAPSMGGARLGLSLTF